MPEMGKGKKSRLGWEDSGHSQLSEAHSLFLSPAVLHERSAPVPEQHQAPAGLLFASGIPSGAAQRPAVPAGADRR